MALLRSEGAAGLTDDGIRSVVYDHADLPEYRQARADSAKALRSLYRALIHRDEDMARMHLRDYFVPARVSAPNQGSYKNFGRFYEELGREQLVALPGIETTEGGRLRFVGVDPGAIDAETRPLEEIRDDPRTEAWIHLADTHGPDTDAYEDLLELFDVIREDGEITTDELADDFHLPSVGDYTDELAGLPYIEQTVETITANDIRLSELDTLADLEAARERVPDRRETWTFHGE